MKIIWKVIYTVCIYGMKILYYTRAVISNILLLIFIIITVAIYFNVHHTKLISKHHALILDLKGIIVDQPVTYNKLQKISKNLFNIDKSDTQENSLFNIVNAIRQAKHDPHITGLILLLKNFSGGSQSSLEYIGKALSEFKQTGKLIYSISDYYSQPQYFLASYANKIYLTNQGLVDLRGFSTDRLYYKSLLENLKINTHIFRVGTYKSAVEPFIRDNMSEPVRYEESIWVNQLWNQYLNIIASNRNIQVQQIFPGIHNILNELSAIGGDTAAYALQKKWVDSVSSRVLIENEMKKAFGLNRSETSYNAISIYDYDLKQSNQNDNQIAIICIQGSIIDGNSDISGSIGGDLIVNQIRNARLNPKVKAIVIRINSPGGSVTASELVRLEIITTRNSGKPVVVSMGNIAASGGYWISTAANFIFASNSTLTGSIGVFGIINTYENTLDKIGVHNDGINTSPISNVSGTKSLPIEFQRMIQLYVETNYKYFVATVAESRHKTINDINRIAQGHIWLGCTAIKHGLIDKIGDFDDAIHKAAELAKISEYQLIWLEDKLNWMDILFKHANKIVYHAVLKRLNYHILSSDLHPSMMITNNNILQFIWNDPKHCYAFCLDPIHYD